MTDQAHAEFEQLIADLSAAEDDESYGGIRKKLWEKFGATGTAFISDMANFSSTSRSLGICHFLKMIHRTRNIVRPLVTDNKGIVLKCDADNCYAFFEDPGDAVQASFDINAELFRINQEHDIDEQIFLSVGIDFGDMLLIGNSDFFGDPVNSASKLGEDLAVKGETLVTERALHRTALNVNENVERMIARISDIELSYVRIPMTQSIKGKIG
jgi:adenylate cyclase